MLSGCAAAAQGAKFAEIEVTASFPIRPYTAIMMELAKMVANGELDCEFVHGEGEHAQVSIVLGASACGARAYTGSSGVGVTYAFEVYSPVAGGRYPLQMAIADRTLDPPGDFGSEHTDCHVGQGSGLAHGLGLHTAGGLRQHPDQLPGRRRPARNAAPVRLPGRLFPLPYPGQGHPARACPGEGIPAPLQRAPSLKPHLPCFPRPADPAGPGSPDGCSAGSDLSGRAQGDRRGDGGLQQDLRPQSMTRGWKNS